MSIVLPPPPTGPVGCDYCPLNKVKGLHKIFGDVRGKEIFLWPQSPGLTENRKRKELVGKTGKWLWRELEAVGITREQVDIQNVVRCAPVDRDEEWWPELRLRNPTKEEIRCCAPYNDFALAHSRAKIHLVFGLIAAKSLLGKEFRKDKRIFWSERLKAKVVCLDHPAFFLRGGPPSRLRQFRKDLKAAVALLKIGGVEEKFGYLKQQHYIGITNADDAQKAARQIELHANKGIRISVDLEDAEINGRRTPLVMGFCPKPGLSYVYALGHPSAPFRSQADRQANYRIVREMLTDPHMKKAMHHGSYDYNTTLKLLNYPIKGYDFDTNYSEYFRYPGRRSYALDRVAEARFPEFVGYKEITMPDALTPEFHVNLAASLNGKNGKKKKKQPSTSDQMYKLARKMNGFNYSLLPWDKMVLYNGADCDLQKRIEISTKGVCLPLLHVYRDAAFVLDRMEKRGPLFDYKQCELAAQVFPVRYQRMLERIRKYTGKPDFNVNSPQQVSRYIYKVLKLPQIDKTPSTKKETMAILGEQHPFPGMVTQCRKDFKAQSTYLIGFKRSADANGGRLRTILWLTGTKTGRLSSGGGETGDDGVVNLQNIHGDPQLQNLVVADLRWRDFYNYWKECVKQQRQPDWHRFDDYYVFLGFDYSQMELRVVAQKSQDPVMLRLFDEGKDIHALVGAELTGWAFERIQKDDTVRRLVKNMQFGIVFGLTEDNLYGYMRAKGVKPEEILGEDAKGLSKSQLEKAAKAKVREFHRKYFRKFQGIARMIERDKAFVEQNGYTETLLGFKRPVDAYEQDENSGYWANVSVNAPIQGTAHQMLLTAIALLWRKQKTYNLLQDPQLEIHDAIYFRVRLGDLWEAYAQGKQLLEQAVVSVVRNEFNVDWQVPLVADAAAGFRFGVKVKKITPEMGTDKFMDTWCRENQALQRALQKELVAVREMAVA